MDDGGSAFPVPVMAVSQEYSRGGTFGMSLRDWFAGMAISGMHASLSDERPWPTTDALRYMADVAYAQADALLEARAALAKEPT